MINLSSFISYHARRSPDKTAFVYEDREISYSDLEDRIGRLGAFLKSREIGAGDIVAVLMKNSPAFLEIAFAVSHIGAVFLPINFRLASDEIGYILGNAEAKLLFVDAELADSASGVGIVIVDSETCADTRAMSGGFEGCPAEPRLPEDLFRLMYTSGTTDRPKGVMHSYANFYCKSSEHVIVLGLGPDTSLLIVGPLYHVGAFDLPGIAVLWQGGMLAIQREFDAEETFSLIDRHRLNGAWLAPVMTTSLLTCPARNRFDGSSLRWVVGGGERTPEARIRSFSEHFRNARYIDAYGLTESCSGDTFMEPGREIEKIGSTGRATPHVEISIRDDAGRQLQPRQPGEICLRGPKIFSGYWKDPEKTASAFVDGWFRTGDVGYLDEDGFLFLTDRKKDMIISGGENISSSEIERVLQLLPEVADVAVIGAPHERWGEVPVAIVVPSTGSTVDQEALTRHCRSLLAGFKVPKRIFVQNELPRNPSGKILKRELRARIQSIIEGKKA